MCNSHYQIMKYGRCINYKECGGTNVLIYVTFEGKEANGLCTICYSAHDRAASDLTRVVLDK